MVLQRRPGGPGQYKGECQEGTGPEPSVSYWLDHDIGKLHSDEQIDLCTLTANHPVLVVNTASFCGYTPQFKGLEALHQQYKDKASS